MHDDRAAESRILMSSLNDRFTIHELRTNGPADIGFDEFCISLLEVSLYRVMTSHISISKRSSIADFAIYISLQ